MTPMRDSHAAACPAGNCRDAEDAQWEEFTAEQLEHLTKAAEHLVAGGFDDEAQQLLSRIDHVRQKQIEETTAEIERLQAKLVALQASGSRPVTAAKPSKPAAEPLR
jgi:dipeptidase